MPLSWHDCYSIKVNTQKKKILYAITKGNLGGAQRYVADLAIAAQESDFDVVVVSGEGNALADELARYNIRHILIPGFGRDIHAAGDIKTFFSLHNILRKERPEIIHTNSSKMGGIGALAARIYNGFVHIKNIYPNSHPTPTARIIFTAHGWAFREDRPLMTRALIRALSVFTVFLSDRIIAVSKKDLSDAVRMYGGRKKSVLIYNGIGKTVPMSHADAIAALFSKEDVAQTSPKNMCIIGTVAELTKNKGLSYAVEAFSLLPEEINGKRLIFIVIGKGEDAYFLKNMIKRLNLSGRVILAGSRQQASSLLSAFDMFLLPSVKEGLPYTILEAGAAKLPVIATNIGGIPEIIRDRETGLLIRPKDPREIAGAIKFFIEHPEVMSRVADTLKHEVDNRFSLDRMLTETMSVYKTVE